MPRKPGMKKTKLSDEEVKGVRDLRKQGLSFDAISEQMKISIGTVSNVVRGKKRYEHLEPVDMGRVDSNSISVESREANEAARMRLMNEEVEKMKDEQGRKEKSAFDDIGKVDLEAGESEEEITELNREREQFNRIKGVEERLELVERAILLSGKNQKTLGMTTEALVKLNERVANLEKILLKAVG